jgi:hypothetical protein
MPTLLPGGYLFQSGKDGKGYVLNGASLGRVSAAPFSGSCGGGSFGGSMYDPASSTIYATCGGLKALAVAGSPPTITSKAGFSATSSAKGPPMIAGGLAWATNEAGTLYGIDPTTGATSAQFSIPENGSDVNHFASPSAGGGRLFVASGDQVTAFTIATAPVLSRLRISPHRLRAGPHRRHFKVRITYTLSAAATVTVTVRRQVRNRKGRRSWVRVQESINLTGQTGANVFRFRSRKPRPGRYQLTAVPSTGGLTGAAHTAKFVVVA